MSSTNKTSIQICNPFTFNHLCTINPILIGCEAYFVAAEVCEALKLINPSDRLKNLDDDEKLPYVVYRSGQRRKVNLINESGLYNLIFQSRKPEAKVFRKWVTNEVLPSIRKTGAYAVPTPQLVLQVPKVKYRYRTRIVPAAMN